MKPKKSPAFTLIELLLGLTISTSMMVLVSSIAISFLQTRTQLTQLADLQSQSTSIMRSMRESLRWSNEIFPITVSGTSLMQNGILLYQYDSVSKTIQDNLGRSLISPEYEIIEINPSIPIFTVENRTNHLSLITVRFTIRNIANNDLSLSPEFTITQFRTLYGPQ